MVDVGFCIRVKIIVREDAPVLNVGRWPTAPITSVRGGPLKYLKPGTLETFTILPAMTQTRHSSDRWGRRSVAIIGVVVSLPHRTFLTPP